MIGSALKKMARENGMTVQGGVAYGSLRGFAATLSEGSGYKKIDFAVNFPDPAGRVALMDLMGGMNLRKEYRVIQLGNNAKCIQVTFHDTIGTMKKIHAFLDWFIPLLKEHGATGADICSECGMPVENPIWAQVNGVCYPLHETCAQRVQAAVEADNTRRIEEDTGNYLTGTLGALLGAAIGAVVWALVLNAGYVASLVGLLIGWLADKGYNLCKGKQGKGKVAILIVAIVLGVVLGTLGADVMTLASMISSGELYGFTYGEIPMLMMLLLQEDTGYLSATISNIGTGLLFAGLGVFFILRQTAKDVSGSRFRAMK